MFYCLRSSKFFYSPSLPLSLSLLGAHTHTHTAGGWGCKCVLEMCVCVLCLFSKGLGKGSLHIPHYVLLGIYTSKLGNVVSTTLFPSLSLTHSCNLCTFWLVSMQLNVGASCVCKVGMWVSFQFSLLLFLANKEEKKESQFKWNKECIQGRLS